jgi:hypothetical protein
MSGAVQPGLRVASSGLDPFGRIHCAGRCLTVLCGDAADPGLKTRGHEPDDFVGDTLLLCGRPEKTGGRTNHRQTRWGVVWGGLGPAPPRLSLRSRLNGPDGLVAGIGKDQFPNLISERAPVVDNQA